MDKVLIGCPLATDVSQQYKVLCATTFDILYYSLTFLAGYCNLSFGTIVVCMVCQSRFSWDSSRVFLQARRRPLLGYTGHSDFVPAPLPSLDRVRADNALNVELVSLQSLHLTTILHWVVVSIFFTQLFLIPRLQRPTNL